ncbi:hypothetical protein RSOLAG1IB_06964 [Rhizoctonia solani AG-1 IB]|uniref:Uncharacterized protein n=1 Tax=Thanatephorus cucumeris (strain AG1-IB / isolate 7/3/14) TaxID=1108050 RepID=A0A0B7FBI6_THACB|nr:hypothetical protein RSOLAG1IB_06964 [Rhizoctonia solani AG-1 IB]
MIVVWRTQVNIMVSGVLCSHWDDVRSAKHSTNGKRLVSGSYDKTVWTQNSALLESLTDSPALHTSGSFVYICGINFYLNEKIGATCEQGKPLSGFFMSRRSDSVATNHLTASPIVTPVKRALARIESVH